MASTWRTATIVALAACAVFSAVGWQHGAASPLAVVDLASDVPTSHIFGVQVADKMGQSLAADDFNGDGTDDILISADEADGPGDERFAAGEAYIIFGSSSLADVIDLATGAADVTIYGAEANDHLAEDVLATGDFNDDGFADALIAARYADGPGNSRSDAGEVYLVFGSASMGGSIDIASSQQDVTIYGADAGDHLATSAAVGDVNGDDNDDIILGIRDGDGPANARSNAGEAYVIFGSPTLSGVIDLAAGGADLTIYGTRASDHLGFSVASGDFSGDGTADILVTATWAYGPGDPPRLAGEAYVVFGSPTLSGTIDIASSQQDFTIYGVDLQDELGNTAAGDLNGDGVDDIVLVAWRGDGPLNARPTAGDAYAIFGPIAQGGVLDLALSEHDLTIYGVDSDDKLAQYVYSLTIGDFNADAVDDILVGTAAADGPNNSRNLAGESYVIFGLPALAGTIDLASAEEIVTIYGAADGDKLGSVAAGDVNGDGIDEVLVAAPYADGVDKSRLACGEAYVIRLGDSDGDTDGFLDLVELYLGTDPLDNCPDDPSDDAWPLDINMDTEITVAGDCLNFRDRIGAAPGDPEWWQRLDLNADGMISAVGDALLYRGMIGESCT
ncbi:MAG: FG-GAP repeat protein [Dehalococcoidia bacterium]|nr:MAG: FG-GAP repeat protein [Dehalococcoidia bacterium]